MDTANKLKPSFQLMNWYLCQISDSILFGKLIINLEVFYGYLIKNSDNRSEYQGSNAFERCVKQSDFELKSVVVMNKY